MYSSTYSLQKTSFEQSTDSESIAMWFKNIYTPQAQIDEIYEWVTRGQDHNQRNGTM